MPQTHTRLTVATPGRGLVEILGAGGRICEDGDQIGLDFDGATTHPEQLLLAATSRLDADFPGLEVREQRSVAGRDTQFATDCRHEHHRRRAGVDLAFGADDVDVDAGCHGA